MSKIRTAQDLLDALDAVKAEYGTLDVPIAVFMQDEDPIMLDELDLFFDGEDQHLHSIQINLLEARLQEGDGA